ncbi:MAG: putative nucleotidyltransferase substrate binding domain-containing protein, partial [Gammaproteobacteria bacterium]
PQALPTCLSLPAWKRFFERLVTDPIGQGIYDSRTLFDLRPAAGDHALAAELTDYLVELLRDHPVFIAVLANDSMINLPPLTLFRDLVVESDRAEHETLDLTRTLLDPLADVGRVFALARHPLAEAATTRRLERAAQSVRSRGALFSAAADAFRIGLYHRTGNAIREQSEGSLVRPASLSRYDQQVLKGCFRTVLDLLELTWANFDSIRDL